MKLSLLIAAAALYSLSALAGNDRPEVIKQAQEKLNVEASGRWDASSFDALKRFQQSKGLQPNGQLDDRTIAELGIRNAWSAPPIASNERAAEPKGSAPGATGS